MARRAGVFVEEFALGMGPLLLSFKGKPQKTVMFEEPTLDEDYATVEEGLPRHYVDTPRKLVETEESTQYSLRLLPIGGFCKMRGADETIPGDPTALNNKTIPQRMLVMAGGSLFNFIAAFILFLVLVILDGYSVPQVHTVRPDTPAYHAGLMEGDRITHLNGRRVALFEDFRIQMDFSGGNPIDVRFIRDGQRHSMYITPMYANGGFQLGFFVVRYFGYLDTVPEGESRVSALGSLSTSAEMILFNLRMPFTLLARLVAGDPVPEGAGVMGPIGMAADVTAIYQQVIQHGILPTVLTMLFLMGLINAALGMMNLLPIPALDGARLVFLGIEGIRKKPVPPEKEGMVHLVGFALLILLVVFIAYRDIMRIIGQ